jgi:hypothetical protein
MLYQLSYTPVPAPASYLRVHSFATLKTRPRDAK